MRQGEERRSSQPLYLLGTRRKWGGSTRGVAKYEPGTRSFVWREENCWCGYDLLSSPDRGQSGDRGEMSVWFGERGGHRKGSPNRFFLICLANDLLRLEASSQGRRPFYPQET